MESETTNLPSGGSDNARPSDDLSNSLTLDDAASLNIDFGDEDDEDQGQTASQAETDPESETDDPEAGEEAETEAETDAEGEKPAVTEPAITLSDGTKLTLKEVEQGFLRERDYRHKTQELANSRRSVAELQARLEQASDTIADFLAKSIPPAPPQELMVTDPIAHYQQLQAHQAALQQVQAMLEQGNSVKDVGKAMSEQDRVQFVAQERSALLEKLPHLRDAGKMEKFGKELASFAQDMGFSNEELAGLTDHRQIVILHHAMQGIRAAQAKQSVQQKVAKAPPVTAPAKAAKQVGTDSARQQALRERFRKSGSIHDAAKLDWA